MQAWIYLPLILSRNLKAENCVLLKVLNRLKQKKKKRERERLAEFSYLCEGGMKEKTARSVWVAMQASPDSLGSESSLILSAFQLCLSNSGSV